VIEFQLIQNCTFKPKLLRKSYQSKLDKDPALLLEAANLSYQK